MSVKAFKEILQDQVLDRLGEYGYKELGENYQKTGACFNNWFFNLYFFRVDIFTFHSIFVPIFLVTSRTGS